VIGAQCVCPRQGPENGDTSWIAEQILELEFDRVLRPRSCAIDDAKRAAVGDDGPTHVGGGAGAD
jgi:hypothetical protein